ncbi:hypothetical protein UFOVP96_15 [uncultured Caudovirales phage]|uniref:Phage tail collar domain containing protein n=1 Tax=uncultured Caudovirales phage TaxID=2100421 RepID=A0A6J5KZ97_9CAUD|nr:hypothetical protein UFOVP96_15 [uncultured Caudovirales phage]
MSLNLSPIGNGISFLGVTGLPLSGGKLYTYQAGSSTPLASYTTSSGTVANANPIILGTDGRPPSEIWITYGYNYKFVLQDSSGSTIATYDNIYGILGSVPSVTPSSLPSGCILMWSGSIGSIPSGFYLCDGTNSTPDLRNRFVVGAGSTYSVGQTGGSADSIVVAHTHTATSTSVVTDPGHVHALYAAQGDVVGGSGAQPGYRGATPANTSSAVTGITVATATTNASTGVSGTNANLPPYYALAFIMAA